MFENLKLGLVILLTGIVVVFSVLVLLILIIYLYSTGVNNAQNTIEAKKVEKAQQNKSKTEVSQVKESAKNTDDQKQAQPAETIEDNGDIPLEVIAVIAAAVDTVFGEGNAVISSITKSKPKKRTSSRRSAWKSAGMAENTRSF